MPSFVASSQGVRSFEVRHLAVHRDRVTGVDRVIAALTSGSVFSGGYDAGAPGRIRWNPEPELSGRLARIMSCGSANGDAYLAVDITPEVPQNGGLFRRVDGPQPRWEWLGEWGHRVQHRGVAWLRGLTAIPDPQQPGRELLLASREVDGVIEIINPQRNHEARVEFDLRKHFGGLVGARDGQRFTTLFAYNEMTPAVHPDTGERVLLIAGGVMPGLPGDDARAKSAWYLVRHADGRYGTGQVFDPAVVPHGRRRSSQRPYRLRVAVSGRPRPRRVLRRLRRRPRPAPRHGVDLQGNGADRERGETMTSRTTLDLAILAATSIKSAVVVLSALCILPTADNFAQASEERPRSGAKILEMFQKADRDGDGKLSREEGRVLPNFAEIDQDRDGFLTPQEIGTFYGPKHATPIPRSYLTREAIEKDTTPPFYSPDGFKPDDVPVGDPGVNYQDPEFLPGGERMTFVDQHRRVWVAELDPLTGLTRSKTGQDILVAENWAPFKHSQNGPEWCLDRLGQAVAFTMLDEQGVPQLALTRLGPRARKRSRS